MVNQIKMDKVDTIKVLLKQGRKYSEISRELGIHRYTVARYARLLEAGEQNSSAAGDLVQNSQNRVISPLGSVVQNSQGRNQIRDGDLAFSQDLTP